MTEKLTRMIVVLVGFRVNEPNSVLYKKFDTPSDSELGKWMNIAFHSYNCDFVSVRRVVKGEQ